MGNVIEVTRDQIIEALLKEPLSHLRAGSWVSNPTVLAFIDGRIDEMACFSGEAEKEVKECHVCAVGAVLRTMLDPATTTLSMLSRAASHATQHSDAVGRGYTYRDIEEAAEYVQRVCARQGRDPSMNMLSVLFEGFTRLALRELENYVSTHGLLPALPGEDVSQTWFWKNYPHLMEGKMRQVRERIVAYVRRHFPKKVLIDIDGAVPRDGVKVALTYSGDFFEPEPPVEDEDDDLGDDDDDDGVDADGFCNTCGEQSCEHIGDKDEDEDA